MIVHRICFYHLILSSGGLQSAEKPGTTNKLYKNTSQSKAESVKKNYVQNVQN